MNSEKIIIAGDFEVLVTKRPGQKNLYIRVSPPDGKITVSAPAKISDKLIKNFIRRKIPQITKARERIRNQFRQSKREYISGETCYFFGVPYMLQVVYEGNRSKIQRVPNTIIMTVPEGTPFEKRKSLLTEWYRDELKKFLTILLLVKKPIECLEYVLIHELVHLLEKNHTNRFKSLVEKYYPAWREAKQILADMPLDYWEK